MWWCLVGPFAELPLHAAGVYRGAHQDCVANYVVSSYTPTLSVLINAQIRKNTSGTHDDILIVSQSDTGDLSPIPNARVEAEIIQNVACSNSLTALLDKGATVQAVTDKLPDATVLHVACHGHQSQDEPLSSGFSLHDKRLTLGQLMNLHMPNAQLAYLSACETAGTDENQPDEAINLAATMLFVGFKSVIATMWYVLSMFSDDDMS
jgi:CHAT domain-containing protein